MILHTSTQKMEQETLTKMLVEIVEFEPQHAEAFAALNYEWLNTYFNVEEHDTEMLDNPMEYIINPGGQILMAVADGKIVGTTALIVVDDETFELAKMAVAPEHRGLKIGKRLMLSAINYSMKVGKKKLMLESNTKLTPAINLYIRTGFKAAPLDPNTPYDRCNIRMELKL